MNKKLANNFKRWQELQRKVKLKLSSIENILLQQSCSKYAFKHDSFKNIILEFPDFPNNLSLKQSFEQEKYTNQLNDIIQEFNSLIASFQSLLKETLLKVNGNSSLLQLAQVIDTRLNQLILERVLLVHLFSKLESCFETNLPLFIKSYTAKLVLTSQESQL